VAKVNIEQISRALGVQSREHVKATGGYFGAMELASYISNRIPYTNAVVADCHECGSKPGTLHNPGCSMERCTQCNGQLISCGCLNNSNTESSN
jgi:hypothetical protein